MLCLVTSELIPLEEPTSPINNDKKVNLLAIAEDFLSKVSDDPVHELEVQDRYS